VDPAAARTAFLEGRGVFAGECALIWVEGPDAERFLQGLLTNDVAALEPGMSCPALLLDDKGRIQAGMTVLRDAAEAFTLVLDPSFGVPVADALNGFHFSEQLEVLGPENAGRITAREGLSHPQVDIETVGRLPFSNEWIVGDTQAFLAETPLKALPSEVFHILRVENGVPHLGVDTNDRTLVQEAGLQAVTASFAKGCYLGQETVARLQHRGSTRRTLRGLHADAPLPLGAEVTGDKPLGTITSAVTSPVLGPIGLAILRTDAAPGDRVTVDGQQATVVELPFGQ
jgi:folate-binding protein YgfZ